MRIVANCMVKNDAAWIWYGLNSILDSVDEVLVWDTGSTDNTVEVIKSISSPKIRFKSTPAVTPEEHSFVRQQMLSATRADWLFILDGDEIWTPGALTSSLSQLSNSYDFLVSSYYNLVGDVYHYQDNSAGRYHIGPYTGHITTRFLNLNNLPGLHYRLAYPLESFCIEGGTPIQNLNPLKTTLITAPYLHATHLRPPNPQVLNRRKYKYELGHRVNSDFVYPRSFYYPHPKFVLSPWTSRSNFYSINAIWRTPLYFFKRQFLDRQ